MRDPLKQWKTSPIDKEALLHWKDYSEARNEMLLKTNFETSPWTIVKADHKKITHIALITDLLKRLKYHTKNEKLFVPDYGLVYSATAENIKEKLF